MNTQNDEAVQKKEEGPDKKELHPLILTAFMISFLLLSITDYIVLKVPEAVEILTYLTLCFSFLTFIVTSCLMSKRVK